MPRLTAPNQADKTHTIVLRISGTDGAYTFSYDKDHTRVVSCTDSLTIVLVNATTDKPQAPIYFQNFASTSVVAMGSPLPSFGPGVTSVTFNLALTANQLVEFAMFVVVAPEGSAPTTLYCDPQIGNDPD
jgi:hypothetical protein